MIEKPKIRKGLAPRHNSASFQTVQDIVIPAGTILRAIGEDEFAAAIGLGPGVSGTLAITIPPGIDIPASALKRVTAA